MMTNCPLCENKLKVAELVCKDCSTKISGEFELNDLFSLSEEDLRFVLTFLKARGNIKEVQKELDIASYYTVRNRLSKVIGSLGFEDKA